jgi:hypothetical protein
MPCIFQTHTDTHTNKHIHRHTNTHTDTLTHTHTDTLTHTQTNSNTHTHPRICFVYCQALSGNAEIFVIISDVFTVN